MSVQDVNLRQTNLWLDGFRQQNQGGQQDQGGGQPSNQSGQVSKTPSSPKDAKEILQGATGE